MFYITLNLNARLQPVDRAPLEDALDSILKKLNLGEVSGGGTMMQKSGEIEFCDIELCLQEKPFKGDLNKALDKVSDITEKLGVPKGSRLLSSEAERPVGTLEGLAYYGNGTDLPDEVYRSYDINYVADKLEECMKGIGSLYSYWEGPTETAFYFYGSSFEEMKRSISDFVNEYPLCQKCRIVQIA